MSWHWYYLWDIVAEDAWWCMSLLKCDLPLLPYPYCGSTTKELSRVSSVKHTTSIMRFLDTMCAWEPWNSDLRSHAMLVKGGNSAGSWRYENFVH